MNSRQRLIIGIGIAVGSSGLVILLRPAPSIDTRLVSVGIAIIALVAFALAFYFINTIFKTDHQSIDLPTPEHRMHAVPGDELDRQFRSLSTLRRPSELSETYNTLQARLEQAALAIIDQSSLNDEQSRKRLIEGTWTDNSYAAAFFGDPIPPKPSIREQLRSLRTGEPSLQYRSRHAVAALVDMIQTGSLESISTSRTNHQDDDNEPSISIQPLAAEKVTNEGDAQLSNRLQLPDAGETIDRRTGRWKGIIALSLSASAAGMLLRQPAVLLASGIGVGLAAYVRAATPPPVDLAIERTVSDTHPTVGSEIQVTVDHPERR